MTRKIILTGCIALFSLQSFGEISLGINLSSNLLNSNNQQNNNNETRTTSYTLGIEPQLLLLIAGFMEIAPSAGFNFSRSISYRNEEQFGESSYFGFDVGCGLYFRVAGNEIIRFSIGPKLFYSMDFDNDSDRYSLYTGVNAPANIDLMFTPNFFVRLSPNLVQIPYSYTYQDEDQHSSSFSFRVITQTSTSLGFFFTF